MKRVILGLLLLPGLCSAQSPQNPTYAPIMTTLATEIATMQAQAKTCQREHSELYCTLHAQQLTLLIDQRDRLCQHYEIAKGTFGCP
jgi:hypothetical protein